MKRLLSGALASAALFFTSAQAADAPAMPTYVEGQHYQRVENPELAAATPQSGAKAEVAEVFWYGCPHCFAFEPKLEAWLKKKPSDVQFVRIPAVLNPSWRVHARTFYALDLMGALDKAHSLLFAGIHEQNRRLSDIDTIATFLGSQGIDAKKFKEDAESLPVNLSIDRAGELAKRYKIDGVPSMVVNGTFVTTAAMAGGYDQMLDVVNYLETLPAPTMKSTPAGGAKK